MSTAKKCSRALALPSTEVMTEADHDLPRRLSRRASTIMADRRVKVYPSQRATPSGVITRMDILTLHVLNPRRVRTNSG